MYSTGISLHSVLWIILHSVDTTPFFQVHLIVYSKQWFQLNSQFMACTVLGYSQTQALLNWIEYSLPARSRFLVECQGDFQVQSHVHCPHNSIPNIQPTRTFIQKNIPNLLRTNLSSTLCSTLWCTVPSTLPCLLAFIHQIILDFTFPAYICVHFQINTLVCTRCHSIVYSQLLYLRAPDCSIPLLWTTILIVLNCILPVCLAKIPLAKFQGVPFNTNSGLCLDRETPRVDDIQQRMGGVRAHVAAHFGSGGEVWW